ADVKVSNNFVFQPGLNFTQKGGKFNLSEVGLPGSGDVDFVLNYIEVPLNVLFKTKAGSGNFFIGAGPSLSFGMSGKAKLDNEEEDINFGSNEQNDDYKPFDFGGNIVAGYQLSNGVFIAINYNATLNNIDTDSDITTKNKYFGIRLGYILGKKK
ncbi:MAG TPA: porin family protein, partial [Allocoleopsis sp.]